MSRIEPPFSVVSYKVVAERHRGGTEVRAIVEVAVGHRYVRRAATGCGPVHALDNALRACLADDFPELDDVELSDYRVSVVEGSHGTEAQVRVIIQATDGDRSWDAGCASSDIIEASFEALCSTAVMGIVRARTGIMRKRAG